MYGHEIKVYVERARKIASESEIETLESKLCISPNFRSFSPSHEAQLRILRRATEVEVEAARKHSCGERLHYPDLQRESGLRVLRGVMERKRSIEDAATAALTATVALTAARSAEMLKKVEDEADHPVLRKRPPAKLKPMGAGAAAMGQRTKSHALSGSF